MRVAAGPPLRTMETVVTENPLSPATSRIVFIVLFLSIALVSQAAAMPAVLHGFQPPIRHRRGPRAAASCRSQSLGIPRLRLPSRRTAHFLQRCIGGVPRPAFPPLCGKALDRAWAGLRRLR